MQKLNNLPINISQGSDFKDESSKSMLNGKADNGERFSKLVDKHVQDDVKSLNKSRPNNIRSDDKNNQVNTSSQESAKSGKNSVASGKKGQDSTVTNNNVVKEGEVEQAGSQDKVSKADSAVSSASNTDNKKKIELEPIAETEQQQTMVVPNSEEVISTSQQLLSFLYAADKTLVSDESSMTDPQDIAQAKANLTGKGGDLSSDEALLKENAKEPVAEKITTAALDNVLNKEQSVVSVTDEFSEELISKAKPQVNLQASSQVSKQVNEQNITLNDKALDAELLDPKFSAVKLTDTELAAQLSSQATKTSEQNSDNQISSQLNKGKEKIAVDINQRTLLARKTEENLLSKSDVLNDELAAESDVKMAEQQSLLLSQEQLKALSKENTSANTVQTKGAEKINSAAVVDPQLMNALLNKNITEDQKEQVNQLLDEQAEDVIDQGMNQQPLKQQEINKQTLSQQQRVQLAQELLVKNEKNIEQNSELNGEISIEDDASSDSAVSIAKLADFTDTPLKGEGAKNSSEQINVNKNASAVQSFTDVVGLATQANQLSDHALSQQSAEALNHGVVGDVSHIQKNNIALQQETISLFKKDFADAVKDKVMIMMSQKLQQFDIRLDPAELGTMQVRLNLQNDQAAVSFVVQSQQTKDALEQNMHKLRDMLAEQGVNVGDANIEQQSQQSNDDQQEM